MQWDQCLQEILTEETYLDNIGIDIGDFHGEIPNIIKASVYLLEKMIKNQGRKNIVVFPDGEQLPFLFMISKLIYDISVGKIENRYSPEEFTTGQILKLGNCICEFIKVDVHPLIPNKKSIFLRFADVDMYCCPLEMAPFFQISNTKKKLSKNQVYQREKKKFLEKSLNSLNNLQDLKNIKTHIKEAVFYIASVANCERCVEEIKLDGESVHDFFFVAKTDYSGNLINYKGKYVGVPALVFASQVSYVNETIENGVPAQSVIINLSECNIDNQLDALDDLLSLKVPIVCVTNTINSFEMQELENRGFNIWRWDEDSISSNIRTEDKVSYAKTINRCVDSQVVSHPVSAPEISEAFGILYRYKKFIENESARMNVLFSQLFSMAYITVRNICALEDAERCKYLKKLNECRSVLEKERAFLQPNRYKNFVKVIENFEIIFTSYNMFPKTEAMYNLLKDKTIERPSSFYLICSNSDNPQTVRAYWIKKLYSVGYSPNIKVLYAKDFINLKETTADVAFVSGWLSASTIKNIIYSYKVKRLYIFTYECEEGWRKAHSKAWRKGLNNENNKTIVQKSFNNKTIEIKTNSEDLKILDRNEKAILAEQDDLDLILQENKYRHYVSQGDTNDIVEARPVGFAGGEFVLYTPTHTILIATNIIQQITNRIEKREVSGLKVGDFVVVRESSKDIVRDVADIILNAKGKGDYRKITALWQEPLRLEEALTSVGEVIKKLREAGCKRNELTIKNWIFSDDLIIPQNKEDLEYIAKVTCDGILAEELDAIYEKGRVVTSAHIKAGAVLSERLTESIAAKLAKEKIDPFNIWDPIELELEEVGKVKILKVIDIGSDMMPVRKGDTNRILAEDKGEILWQE